ncbi:MAG: hypothetical protein QF745_00995, partial [Planctomycetota bacterium]|nr:hypothetical protein [Planctomycetota bacterium]
SWHGALRRHRLKKSRHQSELHHSWQTAPSCGSETTRRRRWGNRRSAGPSRVMATHEGIPNRAYPQRLEDNKNQQGN